MRKLVIPSSIQAIQDELFFADAFLFGLKDLSVHFEHTYTLDELKPVIDSLNKQGKQVFLSCNKNYDRHDLNLLGETLDEIETLPIAGVFFYDLAVLEYAKEKKLNISFIWDQEHMTTNYFSANFYEKQGVKGIALSTNLTIKEITEIKHQTDMLCMVPVFGYYPMFESKRHLVQNYLETFSLEDHHGHYTIEKEGKTYPIIDHEFGTTVYTSIPLNAATEARLLTEQGLDYLIFQERLLEHSLFVKILACYHQYLKSGEQKSIEQIDQLLEGKYDLGFLYKETIYRVKKNG